ncbi:hypothetical protein [Streptomyces sp. SID3343]|uniref:hypothetical protein n=1 Tax=Streptomyces sp. SID3343 TaxID=2690260 RepID=UPI00136F80A1|nr:hypothetical protein [Streptomyces sp. SID3343]MYW05538.1 hypothetical protein [Streptomyces sp. SID3343]
MEPRERAAFVRSYTKVLTAAWSNDEYAARLETDPRAALAENGLELPAGATVRIVRNLGGEPDLEAQVELWEAGTESGDFELRVPNSPQIELRELSEADLESVAGGTQEVRDDTTYCCCCSPCCCCT